MAVSRCGTELKVGDRVSRDRFVGTVYDLAPRFINEHVKYDFTIELDGPPHAGLGKDGHWGAFNNQWDLVKKATVVKNGDQDDIAIECDLVKELLLKKNAAYGSSAFDPVRVFSKTDQVEQIKVRIDDKLSRLMRGTAAGEDVELDLIGYLILLRIAKRRAAK